MKIVIYAVVVMLVSMFSYAAGESAERVKNDAEGERVVVREIQSEPVIPDGKEEFTKVVERVLPTVVGIETVSGRRGGEVSLGSGVIVSEMGYVITNQHVVGESPYKINVTLSDGSVKEAELCWSDKSLDVAVVKFNGKVPSVAKMGEYSTVMVGEDVFAIGNPLSLQFERSVTKGIVSAKNRTISIDDGENRVYMEDLIQTDASINPGNSGGPLMNVKGEVIGINTIRVSSAEGMGFAVPVNICESVIKRLEETGEYETPYLGLYAYTSQTARYLKGDMPPFNGLYVISLDVNAPAYKSGIRYGDVITKINSTPVTGMLELRRELFKYGAEDTIFLTVIRSGKEREVKVDLESMGKEDKGGNQ
ncbi:MAG: trypsin-like peptidase domain-containing protein [Clostridia bacterium]|nr:trypsin-like peptidase domain-containing protein [Clostridia bacterium]